MTCGGCLCIIAYKEESPTDTQRDHNGASHQLMRGRLFSLQDKGGTSAMNDLDKELDEFMEWIRSSEMDFDIDLPNFDFDLPELDFDLPEL